MKHKENGFIVNDFNEVKGVVNALISDAELLKVTSENTMELAKDFDWKNIIKDWEKVIINLYYGK